MNGFAEEIQEIDISGFQVVSGDCFHGNYRLNLPLLTIWHTCISFSKAALTALNNCERVRIEVDSRSKRILIIPVTTADKDGVRWMKPGKVPEARKLDCKDFTMELYRQWEWYPDHVYRTVGRLVKVDQKLMLLFDFGKCESWALKPRVKDALNA